MSNIITQEETKFKDFVFDEQPLYTPADNDNVIAAKPIPANVSIVELTSAPGNLNTLTFNHRPVDTDYICNGVVLRVPIPVRFELTDPLTAVHTEDDYVATFFKNYAELALKPNGLVNAIGNMTVKVNSTQVSSVSNVAEQVASIFPYYDESEVNEFFNASAPDRFQQYVQYDGVTNGIKTSTAFDKVETFRLANAIGVADESIFTNSYKRGYNTRKPIITRDSTGGTLRVFEGHITLETYLPFSIFGLTSSDTSIYGITDLEVTIQLKNEPLSYIFAMKPRSNGIMPYSRIEVNSNKIGDSTSILSFKKIRAPDYITETMKGPDGIVKDYIIEYNDTRSFMAKTTESIEAHGEQQIYLNTVNSSIVPKSIYIAAIRKMQGTSIDRCHTPTVFGRIENLTVEMNAIPTLYNKSAATLYNLCKGNGLNTDIEMGLYTAGFPIKFDVSNDISCSTTAFVGEARQSNFDIRLTVRNLDSVAHEYDVFVTLVYQSYLECVKGSFSTTNALINHDFVKDMTTFGRNKYAQRVRRIKMIGGGFWGDLWGGIKKGAKKLGNYVLDNPQEVIGMAKTLLGKGGMSALEGGSYIPNTMGGAFTSNVMGGSQLPVSNRLGAGNTGVKNVLGGRAVKSAIFK